MPDQLQLRGGTTTEHNSFTGASKEVTVDTTKKTLVVHDGATQGGIPLMKETGANAATSVGIGTGGTDAISIDNNRKVGIGKPSPAAGLDIQRDLNPVLQINRGTGSDTNFNILHNGSLRGQLAAKTDRFIFSAAGTNVPISFFADGSERMRLTSTGELGIGTQSPDTVVHVSDDDAVLTLERIGTHSTSAGSLIQFKGRGPNSILYNFAKIDAVSTGSNNAGHLRFFTNASGTQSERMRIASDGKVGIGATDTSTGQLVVYRATVNSGNPILQARSNHDTTNSVKFEIDGDGDAYFSDLVGVGTTSPTAPIHVKKNIAQSASLSTANQTVILGNTGTDSTDNRTSIYFASYNSSDQLSPSAIACLAGSNYQSALAFYTNAAGNGTGHLTSYERMRITTDGNVRIADQHLRFDTSGKGIIFGTEGGSDRPSITGDYTSSTNNNIKFSTTGSTRMTLDSGGRIGLGTTSPGGYNANADDIVINRSGSNAGLTISTSNSSTGRIAFGDPEDNNIGQIRYSHPDNAMIFDVNADERLRIYSGGTLALSGTHSGNSVSDAALRFAILDSNGNDKKAEIKSTKINDISSTLEFNTTKSNTYAERMRIHSNGCVGVGTNSPTAKVEIKEDEDDEFQGLRIINTKNNAVANTSFIRLGITNAGGEKTTHIAALQESTTGNSVALRFSTNSSGSNNGETEKMRLTSGGHLLHGCTQIPDGSNPGTSINNDANQGQIIVASNSTGSAILLQFRNPNGAVGDIRTGASATTFSTTSDYRLKENAVSISDGITRLKTLKPYKFNFKSDASTVVDGFFAHEVTAVPEAVIGTKDEVASEDNDTLGVKQGEPIYQSIDHSKLVPLLTAALQEAISKIETLETKVAALEAK